MIQGSFGESGELYFEIELIAGDSSRIPVNALLDTAFTGWLAMNLQDIESLEWCFEGNRQMRTARGISTFKVYHGTVLFDGQELTIPVLGGNQITEILLGLPWLETRQLIVNKKAGILTLGDT